MATATLPRPRARPRTHLTLDQAGEELGVPGVVMHRHDAAVQAGDARPYSFPPVHDLNGQRVILRDDFEAFFRAEDGTLVIGYGLMATWAGVTDQAVRGRRSPRKGRPDELGLPAPYTYMRTVVADEPRWRPADYLHWCKTVSHWLMPDGVTPQKPLRAGRPRTRHP